MESTRGILFFVALCAVVSAEPPGPSITTDEKGSVRFTSGGDLVFETGAGGQVQFMTADGPLNTLGEKKFGYSSSMWNVDRIIILHEAKGCAYNINPTLALGDKGDTGPAGMKGDQGERGPVGQKGERGREGSVGNTGAGGENGMKGEMGEKGEVGTWVGAGPGLISWNQCSWANLNLGLDFGPLVSCSINKQRDDTWLRLTWNGNTRVTNCEICCMRWYFTLNGEECSEPGPVDSVIFMEHDVQVLRQTHLSGVCRGAGGRNITRGTINVHFLVMDCPGFGGSIYDAYTGWNSVSRIVLEEIIPRDETFPELISLEPPAEYVYTPHYCQYFFSNLGNRDERNIGTVIQVRFKKEHLFTALRFTWEGNFRQKSCSDCCAQWWFSVDGSRCTSFEDITASIYSEDAIDMFAPTTLTGVCNEVGNIPIMEGDHTVKLEVGVCPNARISDTATGFFSTSRIIVEEVPLTTNSSVRRDLYHPNWEHCAIPAPIPEGTRDNGPLDTLSCGSNFNKTRPDSALQVTFNGNMRLTDCSDCCMRWFITINGEECTQPAPIDAVIYTVNGSQVNIHRGSTITGVCMGIQNRGIGVGPVQVKVNLGVCGGFNETFDSYTGLESLSVIEIRELPPPVSEVPDKPSAGFIPNWIQCTKSDLSSTAVNTSVMNCSFTKLDPESVLKVSWDGNIAVEGCTDCCMRWYITVDGKECGDPGPIDAAIRADLVESGTPQFDVHRPATISGICRGNSTSTQFSPGSHTFGIVASPCPDLPRGSDVLTGYNSISRFIIEELPDQIDDECIITLPVVAGDAV